MKFIRTLFAQPADAILIVALLVLFILAIFHVPAHAQPMFCAPFKALSDSLGERYKETDHGGGVINDQAVLRVFIAPGGASFTVIAVDTAGKACVIATGKDWSVAEPRAANERDS